MIKAGDTLMNPVTKERMTFLKTAAETNGEYVLIELRAAPGAVVAAAHVHPHQTETFEVISGTLGAKIGRKKVEAVAEGVVVIEPKVSTSGGTPARTSSSSAPRCAPRCSSSS